MPIQNELMIPIFLGERVVGHRGIEFHPKCGEHLAQLVVGDRSGAFELGEHFIEFVKRLEDFHSFSPTWHLDGV